MVSFPQTFVRFLQPILGPVSYQEKTLSQLTWAQTSSDPVQAHPHQNLSHPTQITHHQWNLGPTKKTLWRFFQRPITESPNPILTPKQDGTWRLPMTSQISSNKGRCERVSPSLSPYTYSLRWSNLLYSSPGVANKIVALRTICAQD